MNILVELSQGDFCQINYVYRSSDEFESIAGFDRGLGTFLPFLGRRAILKSLVSRGCREEKQRFAYLCFEFGAENLTEGAPLDEEAAVKNSG